MSRRIGSAALLPWVAICLVVIAGAGVARAQAVADDEDEDNPKVPQYEYPESTFDAWAFRDGRSPLEVRAQQEKLLRLQIDDVDRVVKLGDAQRAKLQLAGRADIKQYFEDMEVVRSKFLLIRKDNEKINQIFTELQPLQARLAAGLFGGKSRFKKTLQRIIAAEELARYEQIERERRALRYRAKVEWFVAMLDNVMALTEEQRSGITRLLLIETRPPLRSGEMDHYVIMSQMSLLPEEMARPLFDDAQWKALQVQFSEMKNLEKYLCEQGYLDLDDKYVPAGDLPPEPAVSKT